MTLTPSLHLCREQGEIWTGLKSYLGKTRREAATRSFYRCVKEGVWISANLRRAPKVPAPDSPSPSGSRGTSGASDDKGTDSESGNSDDGRSIIDLTRSDDEPSTSKGAANFSGNTKEFAIIISDSSEDEDDYDEEVSFVCF